ncbi:hypothetical protein [Aureliella helgolandensis]|uniref:hypothetical protein n=1 Tax=Aureliella helgolandensis TaxID=2527968 RepID=UPI0018D075EF|nr:hypothetical protein [Aureliella helgolandensis]
MLWHVDTAANLHEFSAPGAYSLGGNLEPGKYRLLANSGGSDFNRQSSIATD